MEVKRSEEEMGLRCRDSKKRTAGEAEGESEEWKRREDYSKNCENREISFSGVVEW